LKNPSELRELTGIRFFAAFHVLLYHNSYLSGATLENAPTFLTRMISWGDAAVAFFFVLSGFILTYAYTTPDHALRTTRSKFWFARFARLYPIYAAALLIDAPRVVSYFLDQGRTLLNFAKLATSGLAYLLMVQSWYPRVTATWNSPAWSLSCEAFFYLVFPFALLPILRSNKLRFWNFALPIYLFPILAYFGTANLLHNDLSEGSAHLVWRSLPLLRLGEFLIGMYLGRLFVNDEPFMRRLRELPHLATATFWLSLSASLVMIALPIPFPRPVFASTFLVPVFALMIISLASDRVRFVAPFRSAPVVLLGHASYALYITHQPIKPYIVELLSRAGRTPGPYFFGLYAIATVAASVGLYRLLERPCQRLLLKGFSGFVH